MGYHSYNLCLFIDQKQVNFRERVHWIGDQLKGITLRVNTVEPQNITMRFDERVLDVFERTNIAVVTLVDKNGDTIMEYYVEDLRSVYDQYKLNNRDLMVVGGADDEVMKIVKGKMTPIEE